jgi:hypothetical protein
MYQARLKDCHYPWVPTTFSTTTINASYRVATVRPSRAILSTHSFVTEQFFFTIPCSAVLIRAFTCSDHFPHPLEPFSRDSLCIESSPPTSRFLCSALALASIASPLRALLPRDDYGEVRIYFLYSTHSNDNMRHRPKLDRMKNQPSLTDDVCLIIEIYQFSMLAVLHLIHLASHM